MRKFEVVSSRINEETILPKRSTTGAAGYDFFANEDIVIEPVVFQYVSKIFMLIKDSIIPTIGDKDYIIKPTIVKTGVKAYMKTNNALLLFNRSSNPGKLGLILANGVGVGDSDYVDNVDNEGEIGFLFYNIFPWKVTIKKGDKIGQGMFVKYYKTDDDVEGETRTGGFGSTGA